MERIALPCPELATAAGSVWNPIIANVFYRAGIIERWDAGTLNIIDWCAENANPAPTWQEQAGSVYVTFLPAELPESQKVTGEVEIHLGVESGVESKMTVQILSFLKDKPLAKSEIAKCLGKVKPTRYQTI